MTEAARKGETDRVSMIYASLPEPLRREKSILMMRLKATASDDDRYLAALDDYARYYPDAPDTKLHLVDAYFLRKRYDQVIAQLDAPVYMTRQALYDTKRINDATAAVKKAFENQVTGKGYSLVEVLATCPTNWRMTPIQANEHVRKTVTEVYPLGDLVDRGT